MLRNEHWRMFAQVLPRRKPAAAAKPVLSAGLQKDFDAGTAKAVAFLLFRFFDAAKPGPVASKKKRTLRHHPRARMLALAWP